MTELKWNHGDKRRLAEKVGIPLTHLSDILHQRKGASPALAKRISEASHAMGVPLSRLDLLYPEESCNPLMPSK